MQSLFYITFNGLTIICFIMSVSATLVAYSDLALQLLESKKGFPPSMVFSWMVHVQQSVLCTGDSVNFDEKLSSKISFSLGSNACCIHRAPSALSLVILVSILNPKYLIFSFFLVVQSLATAAVLGF